MVIIKRCESSGDYHFHFSEGPSEGVHPEPEDPNIKKIEAVSGAVLARPSGPRLRAPSGHRPSDWDTLLVPQAASSSSASAVNELHFSARPEKLEKGNFGKATKIITDVGTFVAKYGRKRIGDKAFKDVEKEYLNHRRLFPTGEKIYGLQEPYRDRLMIHFPRKAVEGTRGVMANVGHFYNSKDYMSLIYGRDLLPFEDYVAEFHQIFHALHYMEQMKVIHQDIKPENILLDRIGSGLVVDTSDIANLEFDGDEIPARLFYTPAFIADNDEEAFGMIVDGQETYNDKDGISHFKDLDATTYKKARTLKGKIDVYATGTMLYESLTKSLPFKLTPEGLSLPGKYPPIDGIPPEFNSLLARMLDPNYKTRIGRTEAWIEFNRILDLYPDLKMRVEANIAAIGRAPPMT